MAPPAGAAHGSETVFTDNSEVAMEAPRDRNCSFEPQLANKCQSRLPGFDEKVRSPCKPGA